MSALNADLRRHARQRLADADVGAAAERELVIGLPRDVECVGIVEARGIAVDRANQTDRQRSGRNADVAALEIVDRRAGYQCCCPARSAAFPRSRFASAPDPPELFEFRGVLQERQQPIAEQRQRRPASRDEHRDVVEGLLLVHGASREPPQAKDR